ncbi:hypothetical protein NQ317_014692 [Molorchus minor]|uniref:THAP-type domain-containing protein n=1 Tax=Molorchus minor TaxID=1323400 RepID=A0ABQ9JIR6_9CUCU|nr:hypothetical protein NQ317_014692 [Molorchus minor]
MNSSYYKYCIVPQCKSTITIKTPNKFFIYVPSNEQIRKKWLKLARRDDVHSLSTNSRIICNFVNLTSKATPSESTLSHYNGTSIKVCLLACGMTSHFCSIYAKLKLTFVILPHEC